jgi:hypothetical protein
MPIGKLVATWIQCQDETRTIRTRGGTMPGNVMPRCEFNAQDLILRLETIIPADVTRISPIVEQVMELTQQLECTTGK